MLVRSDGLADTMSRYLIRRIEQSPNIVLRTRTELVALEGNGHLEGVRWRDPLGDVEDHAIRHVFVMTGAAPSTDWLRDCVVLDEKGFIKTGPGLSPEDLAAAEWPLVRRPFSSKPACPGSSRSATCAEGNVKRVASAVGEGAIAVALVHQVLRE